VLLHNVDWLDADPPILIGYATYLVSDIVQTIPWARPCRLAHTGR
jgi:hypothetical protein